MSPSGITDIISIRTRVRNLWVFIRSGIHSGGIWVEITLLKLGIRYSEYLV